MNVQKNGAKYTRKEHEYSATGALHREFCTEGQVGFRGCFWTDRSNMESMQRMEKANGVL